MEKDNKELEENFLSRWSKKKSKQKSEIENSKYEQLDKESSEETEDSSSLVEENDKLNDDELLKKYKPILFKFNSIDKSDTFSNKSFFTKIVKKNVYYLNRPLDFKYDILYSEFV